MICFIKCAAQHHSKICGKLILPPIQLGIIDFFFDEIFTYAVISFIITNSKFLPAKVKASPGSSLLKNHSSIMPK